MPGRFAYLDFRRYIILPLVKSIHLAASYRLRCNSYTLSFYLSIFMPLCHEGLLLLPRTVVSDYLVFPDTDITFSCRRYYVLPVTPLTDTDTSFAGKCIVSIPDRFSGKGTKVSSCFDYVATHQIIYR